MRAAAAVVPMLWAAASWGAVEVAAGPYLTRITRHSATVNIHFRRATAVELHVFSGRERVAAVDSPASRSHAVVVVGLEPNRVYRCVIRAGEDDVATLDGFRTAGRPGDSFTFAVYGDTRPGQTKTKRFHRNVVSRVRDAGPCFRLVLGDMVDDGSEPAHWEAFFAAESPLAGSAGIFPVMGDNDYDGGDGLFGRYFPDAADGFYHFRWNGVHFFALNARDARGAQDRGELDADSRQLRWLKDRLSRPEVRAAPFRIVFMHDPVYICRGRSARLMRDVWARLFVEHGVDLVFSSWHLYERSRHDGVHYVLTGGGGAELVWMRKNDDYPAVVDARRHHFCRVDVFAGGLTLQAIAADGTVLDRITLSPRAGAGDSARDLKRKARILCREIPIPGGTGTPELPVYLFSYDCAYCDKLLRHLLPRWADEHGVSLHVCYYDFARKGTYDLFMAAGADFGRQDAGIPAIFAGREVFGGSAEIERGFPAQLAAFRRDPARYREQSIVPFTRSRDTAAMRRDTFDSLTLGLVISAGLVDGLNPCAFAAVIFLVSYLTLVGGTRRQILLAGGLFTAGVFAAYMLIGMFLYRIAGMLPTGGTVRLVVNCAMLALLAALTVLSLVDFVRCLRGRPEEITLRLPDFLNRHLRARVRRFARRGFGTAVAAVVLGMVVASIELGCTGQVYIPIVNMLAEPDRRPVAFGYLVIYNTAFIVPLLAVFLSAAAGVTSERMAAFFRRRAAWVKLALAVVFILLAAGIMHTTGWIG